MEFHHYLKLAQKWWWLIVILSVLAGGLSYVRVRSRDPLYQSEVKIFIGGYLENPNPGGGEISTGANLALTYGNIVKFRPILDATIQNLGLQTSAGALAGQIATSTIPSTSILVITVTDGNPVQAANIANELAAQLVSSSPTNLSPEQQQNRQLIQTELSDIGFRIQTTRTELQRVQALLDTSVSETEKARLEESRDQLADEIVEYQSLIADLSTTLLAIGTPVNQLRVVDPALIPQSPIATGSGRSSTILAAIIGAGLAVGIALLVEQLDDSIRSAEEVRELLKLNVLAGIVRFGNRKDTYREKLITLHAPNSTPAESYRALRTHLLYGNEDEPPDRLIVTSPNISEGKSVTSANLAVALAQAGLNTVIIDADLRRPRVHEAFGLDNRVGLSSIFSQPLQEGRLYTLSQLNSIMQPTELPGLKVITSGPIPANPAELLGLSHLRRLCQSLKEEAEVDMILFDTPPVLAVIDSITLASNVGAGVVLVVHAGHTKRAQIQRVLEETQQIGVKLLGVVLNRITSQTEGYTYYYSYGRYAKSPSSPATTKKGTRELPVKQ